MTGPVWLLSAVPMFVRFRRVDLRLGHRVLRRQVMLAPTASVVEGQLTPGGVSMLLSVTVTPVSVTLPVLLTR